MEEDENNMLPEEFTKMFANDKVTFRWKNVAKTYHIQSSDGNNKYLKIQKVGLQESLERQSKRLTWCHNKIPVPEVVGYGVLGNYEYLLTLELLGIDSTSVIFKNNIEETVVLLAHGLRRIHEVSIRDCPFDNSIDQLMKIIKYNYEHALINSTDIYNNFGEAKIAKLINELELYFRDMKEDLVFTHGDYSLPNIIIHDGCISGYIDLGNCGIADRYYDLAVAEKSIIRNLGKDFIDLFYNTYGLSNVDRQRIRFYKIVEQLVWV